MEKKKIFFGEGPRRDERKTSKRNLTRDKGVTGTEPQDPDCLTK